MLTEEKLVDIFKTEFATAIGADDVLKSERKTAYDRYLGEPLGTEVKDESQVHTSEVADVVDGVMPSLLRLFTTADNLVGFDAFDQEDEEKAAQETDYVSYVFFNENPAFMILYSWFFDALLQKTGTIMAWWDKRE